jgi:hypothetical protein
MVMRFYLKLTCVFLFLTLLTSCEKNDDSTKTKGDISGKVALYDEGTASLPNEDMSVRIMNLNPEITASTDASGSFTLKDVPYGNYRLLLEKDGYGPYQWADIVHEKSNTSTILTNTVSLGKISSTQVTDMSVVVSGNNVFCRLLPILLEAPAIDAMFDSSFIQMKTSVRTITKYFLKPLFYNKIPQIKSLTELNGRPWDFPAVPECM